MARVGGRELNAWWHVRRHLPECESRCGDRSVKTGLPGSDGDRVRAVVRDATEERIHTEVQAIVRSGALLNRIPPRQRICAKASTLRV